MLGGLEATGQAGVGLTGAGRRPVGTAVDAFEGTAKLVSKLNPGLGLFVEAASKSTRALNDMAVAFIERGRELSRFSGELAAANAMADVRRLQGDIREARTLGPGIAQITDSYSQIADSLREIFLPIQKFFVETLAAAIEGINDFLKEIMPTLQAMSEVLVGIFSFLRDLAVTVFRPIMEVIKWIARLFGIMIGAEEEKEKKEKLAYAEQVMRDMENMIGLDDLLQIKPFLPEENPELAVPAFNMLNLGGA